MDKLQQQASEIIMAASIYSQKSEIPQWIIQLNERLIRIEQVADSLETERLHVHQMLDQQKEQLLSMISRIPPHLFDPPVLESDLKADIETDICETDTYDVETVVDEPCKTSDPNVFITQSEFAKIPKYIGCCC
jgi:hypothetical protein